MPVTALTACLSHVFNNIPEEILEAAFEPDRYNVTLDERIITEVIRGRVLISANLLTGRHTRIPLFEEYREDTVFKGQKYIENIGRNEYYEDMTVFRVPPEAREGKNIAHVYGAYPYITSTATRGSGYGAAIEQQGNSLTHLSNLALRSHTIEMGHIQYTPYLLGDNIVRIYPRAHYTYGLALDCLLEYDDEFTNMDTGTISNLTELVLNATKTFIYTKLIIKVDANEIIAGHSIGKFRDIIESYADEKDRWEELLMKFKASNEISPEIVSRMVRYMI